MRAIFCFDCFGETAFAKLCIKSLIPHDVATLQCRDSNPSPYFACEIKIRQKMSTKLQARGISRDSIAPALRELDALGVIRCLRPGYGGPTAKARAESHFELAFLGPGKKPYEKNLSVEEWGVIFAEARARKSVRHVRNGKKSSPPLKSIFSVPLEPTSSVPLDPTRYPPTSERGPVCSVPLEPTIPSYASHEVAVAAPSRLGAVEATTTSWSTPYLACWPSSHGRLHVGCRAATAHASRLSPSRLRRRRAMQSWR
jgi:hypothetical protein